MIYFLEKLIFVESQSHHQARCFFYKPVSKKALFLQSVRRPITQQMKKRFLWSSSRATTNTHTAGSGHACDPRGDTH